MRSMSGSVAPVGCGGGRDSAAARAADNRPAARWTLPPIDGPHIKGHRVAFPAGLLCAVGDLGRSVVQPADHCQQVCVVHRGIGMS